MEQLIVIAGAIILDTSLRRPARLKIRLTPGEELWLSQIQFDASLPAGDAQQRSLRAARSLAESLVGRGGVPRIRWLYFTDPELNIGLAKSRKQQFEESGSSGPDILSDPRFLPLLHYWVFGPQLPPDIINWFFVAVAHHTDLRLLRRSVRQAVRDHGLPPQQVGEEFYKLGLEAGLHAEGAWSLRNAVCSMRMPH